MTDRDAALELYTKHERRIVSTIIHRLGGGPDFDYAATESDARFALWRAAQSYDPARGMSFNSWGMLKAQKAVIDGIRERTHDRGKLGSSDCEPEPVRVYRPLPLSLDSHEHDDGRSLAELIPDQRAADDLDRCEARLMSSVLSTALRDLNDRQRHVVVEVVLRGRTMLSVASDLGVGESRVCQIHSKARQKMRRALGG
jgi:RNA polymerase sigma factor (sigma-70 family)